MLYYLLVLVIIGLAIGLIGVMIPKVVILLTSKLLGIIGLSITGIGHVIIIIIITVIVIIYLVPKKS